MTNNNKQTNSNLNKLDFIRNIHEILTGPHCERIEWSQPEFCFALLDEELEAFVVVEFPSLELL